MSLSNTIFSLHVSRSGGTSLSNIFKEWFGDECFLFYRDHLQNTVPILEGTSPFILHGHLQYDTGDGVFDRFPEASKLLLCLRHPLELQISLYHFIQSIVDNGSFYYKTKLYNKITVEVAPGEMIAIRDIDHFMEVTVPHLSKFLPPEYYNLTNQEIVDQLYDIVVYDRYIESIERLSKKWNKPMPQLIPHRNKQHYTIQPSRNARKLFEQKSEREIDLYNFVLDHFHDL